MTCPGVRRIARDAVFREVSVPVISTPVLLDPAENYMANL